MRKLILLSIGALFSMQSYAQSVPTFQSQRLHILSKEDSIRLAKLKNVPITPVASTRAGAGFTPHDYSKGFFLVNEDWYGHRNSTINHFDDDWNIEYETVKSNNPGKSLGCTNQYAMIWGNKVFCVSKQNQDPGEKDVVGARFTVLDKKTMKIEVQFKEFPNKADGRGCVGVSPSKVYVGTSSGILVYDIGKQQFTKAIEKTGATKPNDLYHGQIGSMVRMYDYVYAVHQSKGLLVVDADADTLVSVITPLTVVKNKKGKPVDLGFGSVVASKDGRLWLSVCDPSGSGQAYKFLECYDPKTKQHTVMPIDDKFFGPGNSWYAWTPDGFCASTQNNVLYWNGGRNSWFSNKMIFKFDIDKNEITKFIDIEATKWKMYGCSFRIHPVTDKSIMSQYIDFGNPTYQIVESDTNGDSIKCVPLKKQYWFPSIPMFPDNALPKYNHSFLRNAGYMSNAIEAEVGKEVKLSLKDMASDADNMECLMIKWVYKTTNNVKGAYVSNDTLHFTPNAKGQGMIAVRYCSNGQFNTATFDVKVKEATTGIENARTTKKVVAIYSIDGKKLKEQQRGINILKYEDGTVEKVIVR